MDFVEIDIDIRIKGVWKPQTIREKLKYFFSEQRVVYQIGKTFSVQLSNGEVVTIEKGFETDLRSVPPFLHSVMSNCPSNVKAYVLHDWMYKTDYKRDELGDRKAKQLADYEMLYLANELDSDLKKQNELSHFMVDKFGNKIFKRRKEDE